MVSMDTQITYQLAPVSHQAMDLAHHRGVSPIVAQLLYQRGVTSPEAIDAFLDPHPELVWPKPLFHQDLLAYFQNLLSQGKKIAIHGDYDADGLTGTTVLYEFFTDIGFEVLPFLPTRGLGYGLHPDTLKNFQQQDIHTIITVDCGISNGPEIDMAKSMGMDVIVTDHHGLPEVLPEARFTLHPLVLDIPEIATLSGAGVAYWMVQLLYPLAQGKTNRPPEYYLEIATIGSVADMTPLTHLNRDLVKRGLKILKETTRPGLLALYQMKNLTPELLTEEDLSFRVIPSLNAAGRIQSPMLAFDLLTAPTLEDAKTKAEHLNELNTIRQQLCQDVLSDVLEAVEPEPEIIVMADEIWLHGVLGIVCSQLVERFQCPVFLMAIEGNIAKASVRSPEGFHVLNALKYAESLFIKYGGHAQAGGFSIHKDRIKELKPLLLKYLKEAPMDASWTESIDYELSTEDLDFSLYHDIRKLAPFGMGNPFPVFLMRQTPLKNLRPDRKSGIHLFADVKPEVKVKGWKQWKPNFNRLTEAHLVFTLQMSEWRNRRSLELNVKHIQAASEALALAEPPVPQHPSVNLEAPPLFGFVGNRQGFTHYKSAKSKEAAKAPYTLPEIVDCRHLRSPDALEDLFQKPGTVFYAEHAWDFPADSYLENQGGSPPPSECELVVCSPVSRWEVLMSCLQRYQPERVYLIHPHRKYQKFGFRELFQTIQYLQKSGDISPTTLLHNVATLVKRSPYEVRLMLKNLYDLHILTYDNERYGIHLMSQTYHLKQSESYAAYSAEVALYEIAHQLWLDAPLSHIKHALKETTHD